MIFPPFEVQIAHTSFTSMGQHSLSVLRHRLLQGLLAVENGNCGWKAVQRKCVALWKWGCLAPKIQFL